MLLTYEVYYNRDFPDQTDFPEHVISGMRRTIKQHPERVNCHPIRSIAPLLLGNRLHAKRESPELPASTQGDPMRQPISLGQPRNILGSRARCLSAGSHRCPQVPAP